LDNVGFGAENKAANMLPPEILMLGITVDQWHPIDSLAILKSLNFHLTFNWQEDLHRSLVAQFHPDMEELIDEMLPYSANNAYDLVTILDDSDVRFMGQWSDETLFERY
jgi:acyl-homoserine lactone acylase PvdQ